MHIGITALLAAVVIISCAAAQSGDPAKKPKPALAGWLGVYPSMSGYQLTFQPVSVDADKKSPTYKQSASYQWSGGADRRYVVTVIRDANLKTTYGEAEMKKAKPVPEKTEVGKQSAWLWKTDPPRLVVILGDDRAVLFEQSGLGPFAEDLRAIAGKFDFNNIKEALENPPLTGSRRTVDAFRQLKKGMSYAEIGTWVGIADKDIGSGIHIMVYALDDGSEVLIGFPDFNKLIYVKHKGKDGKVVDLVK